MHVHIEIHITEGQDVIDRTRHLTLHPEMDYSAG